MVNSRAEFASKQGRYRAGTGRRRSQGCLCAPTATTARLCHAAAPCRAVLTRAGSHVRVRKPRAGKEAARPRHRGGGTRAPGGEGRRDICAPPQPALRCDRALPRPAGRSLPGPAGTCG
jgi:hypothetical protein